MNAKQIAVHEVDGRRMHSVPDGLAEYAAALGAEFADTSLASVLPRSRAYREAAALLSVYRSRVDFLGHRALDTGADRLCYRSTPMPALSGPEPAVTH